MKYAEVVVSIPIRPRAAHRTSAASSAALSSAASLWEKTFHYAIPPHLSADIAIGQMVVVPFGPDERQGIILALSDTSPVEETREILAISDRQPVLSLPRIELARWISRHYLAPLPQSVQLMLPPGVLRRPEDSLELGEALPSGKLNPSEQSLLDLLRQRGRVPLAVARRHLGAAGRAVISRLLRAGYIVKHRHLGESRVRPKIDRTVRLIADDETIDRSKLVLGHPSKQADILCVLLDSADPLPDPAWVLQKAGCLTGPLQELEKRGFVQLVPRQEMIRPVQIDQTDAAIASLTEKAAATWNAIQPLLLACPEGIEVRELCRSAGCQSQALVPLQKRHLIERITQEAAVMLAATPAEVVDEIIRLHGADKHIAVLEFLRNEGATVWIGWVYAQTGATLGVLQELQSHHLIQIEDEEVIRNPLAGRSFGSREAPRLTPDQEKVWRILSTDRGKTFLLRGVTGSGKTEIYLRALEAVLAQGRGAIVLVPEIALTPQTIQRFSARFPDQVAVQHSGLLPGERYDLWRQIRARKLPIVIGTRSALFAPVPNLGLIVIDEEHEPSYKQDMSPRYHAREVATQLAQLTGATLILGSATPDIISYARARRGDYTLLELPRRILWDRERLEAERAALEPATKSEGRLRLTPERVTPAAVSTELPPVQVVDMREELRAGNRSIFSRALTSAVQAALGSNEQIILFLNRRGTETFVLCRDCGTALKCRHCDVSLTYHAGAAALQCHYCNRSGPVPERCPTCGSKRIKFFGLGTEKVAALAAEAFPGARLLRWDRDVTGARGAHEAILGRFTRREADILIGTQMIAKGLDLPLVTVVGVISADTVLYLPDFRSGERTFQLLTQVAGRAGRSVLGGQVIIQTYAPEHYAIRAASQHDYEGFYREEMAFRRRLRYPPYSRLIRLIYTHSDAARCRRQAEALGQTLTRHIARLGLPEIDLIGPAPCFLGRLKGKSRWHLVIRGRQPLDLLQDFPLPPGWQVDVDPVHLL